MLPSLLLVGFVFFYPILKIIPDSFFKYQGGTKTFVGLQNYYYLLFEAPTTKLAFLNNLKLILVIPILLLFSIIFAFIFYSNIKGTKIYQTVVLLPKVISIVVVGILFSYLLRDRGIINEFLKSINLSFLAQNWLSNHKIAIYSIGFTIIWKELGFGIILFLSRLTSLDERLLDAAKVDGANTLQTLLFVIIPQLKGLINFYIVYHIMIIFSWIFSYVFVITGGGPAGYTTVLELEIYKYAFQRNMPGMASALSIILLLAMLVFIYLNNKLQREAEEF